MPQVGRAVEVEPRLVVGAQGTILRRPRLEVFLDELVDPGSSTRLALVCAGPGFGKTTLVRSWGEVRDQPLAYVSFQGAAPTPSLFWRLVLRALAEADETVAAAVQSLAAPDRTSQPDFVVELSDALATRRLVLVLDDLHAVVDPKTLTELDHLLRRLPSSVRTVILSRSEPTLPVVHDLKIAGVLHQVRAASLAFTFEEVAAVCADLPPDDQRLVMEQTEGWPAMVRLMLVALLDGLDGSEIWDREVELFDHLFAEVFNRRHPSVQEVLLMSSVSDPAPLALVVELTGQPDAGATLDQTARQSGLISRRTGQGEVAYHLHPILGAFLRAELMRQDLTRERAAHLQASRWHLRHDDGLRAVRQALLAEDPCGIEEALESAGLGLVNEGQSERLITDLVAGPPRVPGPWESVVGAAALLDLGRVDEAAARLSSIAAHPLPPGLPGIRDTVHDHLVRRQGRESEGLDPAAAGDAHSPDSRLFCALHRGTGRLQQGHLGEAEDDLALAAQLASGLRRPAALVDSLTMLAALSSARSDFAGLAARTQEAVELAERTGWARSQRAAFLHLFAGWSARQSLDDARARRHADTALGLVQPDDDPTVVMAIHVLHAALEFQTHEGVPADAHRLHELWRMAEGRFLSREFVVYAATLDAHFSLALGRVDRLHRISKVVLSRVGETADWQLVEALHQLALGKRRLATRLLGEASQSTPVVPLTQVEVLSVSARMRLQEGDDYAARQLLDQALEEAAPLGGVRSVVDAGGSAVAAFLRDQRGSWGHHEDLVTRVVEHMAHPPSIDVPLTERELAVLRQLPTMRTVDEIATTLVVSANTVKTHLRNVYRKLGVASRRDAVSEARRWGLL